MPRTPEHPETPEDLAAIVQRELDRRTFLQWAGRGGLALGAVGAFGALLEACGASTKKSSNTTTTGRAGDSTSTTSTGAKRDVSGMPKKVKVGVIAPFDGLGAFVGGVVTRSLNASQQHIKDAHLYPGIDIEVVNADAKAEEQAEGTSRAYQELVVDPEVIGILWCTPFGLKEAQGSISRDGIPVIAVYYDLYSEGLLYPDGPERSIFQMYLPERKAIERLLEYAKNDRGYESAGLIHDTITPPGTNTKQYFEDGAAKAGIEVAGIEQFNLLSADYGSQIGRLKSEKPHCLLVWGLSENTAGIVKALDAIGAGYVDTPTAKGPDWHPHIMGSPGATGEKSWAALAGNGAKPGTLTCWYMGGFVGLPDFPIRDWMKQYQDVYPTGGEEVPANGLYALLEAARLSKSNDRAKIVAQLERFHGRFASLEYGWEPKHHLSLTDDQLALVSLEHMTHPEKTDPPYVLGKEKDIYLQIDSDYYGPTILVRPTLEANKRAYPETMKLLLEGGYGIQCTKHPADATGVDVKMSKDCKIH